MQISTKLFDNFISHNVITLKVFLSIIKATPISKAGKSFVSITIYRAEIKKLQR